MEESASCAAFAATDFPALPVRAVGVIRNAVAKPMLKTDDHGISLDTCMEEMRQHIREIKTAVSEIIIHEELLELLDGIDDYSHLVVLYWGHQVPESGRLLTRVHPMGRKEFPKVGIFGTRSPARPNPVLMTTVRLKGREGNVLRVTGLDAINNSPVIDIKPHVPERDSQGEVRMPGWMARIQEEIAAGDARDD
jgi:tRNA-Thr(GGU) m(6)t(6)A37 methyltransferase TsaA